MSYAVTVSKSTNVIKINSLKSNKILTNSKNSNDSRFCVKINATDAIIKRTTADEKRMTRKLKHRRLADFGFV